MKRYAVALVYGSANNNVMSKLHVNVDANSEAEAIGIKILEDKRLFENWKIQATLVQEQVVAEQEEVLKCDIKIDNAFKDRVIPNEDYRRFVSLMGYFKNEVMTHPDEFDECQRIAKELTERGY